MDKKPLILIVNDDGIFSPGLAALCDAVKDVGELLIVAPSKQQTSMGRSYPKEENLGVIEEVLVKSEENEFIGYSVCASPAFCVAYAIKEIAQRKPDLCISGINYGENLGLTVTYSGTIGAAMQAVDFKIPTIAISRPADLESINCNNYVELNWDVSKRVINYWTKKVLKEGIPFNAPFININVPDRDVSIDEFNYTRQAVCELFPFIESVRKDFSKPYKLPSKKMDKELSFYKGTDLYEVFVNKNTSITPMGCDLTFKEFDKYKIN